MLPQPAVHEIEHRLQRAELDRRLARRQAYGVHPRETRSARPTPYLAVRVGSRLLEWGTGVAASPPGPGRRPADTSTKVDAMSDKFQKEVGTMKEETTGSWSAFARHFVEMIAAMVVGMAVLGGLVSLVLWLLGQGDLLDPVPARAIAMATNMSVGMGLWMRHRGHGWSRIAEMSAAMYAPFLVLLAPYEAGLIAQGPVMGGGHLLMLLFMLAVMLPRYAEYSQDHRAHSAAAADHRVHHQKPEVVSA